MASAETVSLIPSVWILNYPVKNLSFLIVASAVLIAVEISSCKTVVGPKSGPDIVFPSKNISFYSQVLPLFLEACDYSGCHDQGTQAGGLELEDYAGVFSVPGVVVPGDTLHSRLVQSIEGVNGNIMPPPYFGTPLNSNQINGIKQWILEGAKNTK